MTTTVLDDLGRVTLTSLGYEQGCKFEIEIQGENIALIQVEDICYKLVRGLDALGRLVLPIDLRNQAGFKSGDMLELKKNGVKIMLVKIET